MAREGRSKKPPAEALDLRLAHFESLLRSLEPKRGETYPGSTTYNLLVMNAAKPFVDEVMAAARNRVEGAAGQAGVWVTTGGLVNMEETLRGLADADAAAPYSTHIRPLDRVSPPFQTLLPALDWERVFIAGGAAVRLFLPPAVVEERREHWGGSDLDLWARGEDAADAAERAVEAWAKTQGAFRAAKLGLVSKFEGAGRAWQIDVICIRANITPAILCSTFDLPPCRVWAELLPDGASLRVRVLRSATDTAIEICPICEVFASMAERTTHRAIRYRGRGFLLAPRPRLCRVCHERARARWDTGFVVDPEAAEAAPERTVEAPRLVSSSAGRLGILAGREGAGDRNALEHVLATPEERQYLRRLIAEYDIEKTRADVPDAEAHYARQVELRDQLKNLLERLRAGEPILEDDNEDWDGSSEGEEAESSEEEPEPEPSAAAEAARLHRLLRAMDSDEEMEWPASGEDDDEEDGEGDGGEGDEDDEDGEDSDSGDEEDDSGDEEDDSGEDEGMEQSAAPASGPKAESGDDGDSADGDDEDSADEDEDDADEDEEDDEDSADEDSDEDSAGEAEVKPGATLRSARPRPPTPRLPRARPPGVAKQRQRASGAA